MPALLGLQDGIYVFTSRIYFVFRSYPRDLQAAGALAVSLLLIAVIGVIVARLLAGKGSKTYQTVTGKGFRPRPLDLGKWKPVVGAGILIYFFATVVGPLLVLLYAALLPFYQAPSWDAFSQFTFDNFQAGVRDAVGRPRPRQQPRPGPRCGHARDGADVGRRLDLGPVQDPGPAASSSSSASCRWSSPASSWAVSISFVYLRFPFPVYGTLLILLIAYMTKYMPYGMRYASTSMTQISSELEESAQVSGAGWFTTFRRVLLPLLSPGLLAGFIYILVVSFRELSSSMLLYSPGNEVLSILIWEQFENGSFNVLAAIGVLMVLALVVMVTIAYKLGAKVGLRED